MWFECIFCNFNRLLEQQSPKLRWSWARWFFHWLNNCPDLYFHWKKLDILSKEPLIWLKIVDFKFSNFYEFCCSKKIMNVFGFTFSCSWLHNFLNPCPILIFFISNCIYYSWVTISRCLNSSELSFRGCKTALKLRYEFIFHRL